MHDEITFFSLTQDNYGTCQPYVQEILILEHVKNIDVTQIALGKHSYPLYSSEQDLLRRLTFLVVPVHHFHSW